MKFSKLTLSLVIFAFFMLFSFMVFYSLGVHGQEQYTCSSMKPDYCSKGTCPKGYTCELSGKSCTCIQVQQKTTTTTTTIAKETTTTTTLSPYSCSSMKPPNCGQGTCPKGERCIDYQGLCKCLSVTTTTTTTTTISKCPSGCECLTAEDAKKKGYYYCEGEKTLCDYDQYQNPMYCYEPAKETTTTIKITTTTVKRRDKTPPKVTLRQIPSKITPNETIRFIAEAKDESGISNIEIIINGKQVKKCKKSPCEFETEFPSFVEEVDFGAIVSDDEGNMLAAGSIFGMTEGIDEDCPEDDGGMNPFLPGRIMTEPGRIDYENGTGILPTYVYDTCLNETFLEEYFCNGTEIQSQIINCRGTCYRGARLALPDGGSMQMEGDACICVDGDDGRNYYERAYITSGLQDICTSNLNLREYYCDPEGGGIMDEIYRCPNGCEDGVCICGDSDGGRSYFTQGTTEEETDYCIEEGLAHGRLREYFCDRNHVVYEDVSCICRNNSCECHETDRGRNYFQKGRILKDPLNRSDECLSSRRLREYYCDDGELRYDDIECYSCVDGACVCEDSDGGVDYFERGTTSVGNTDYCFDTTRLIEYFVRLEGNDCVQYSASVDCEVGCESGACIQNCHDGMRNCHDDSCEEGIDCGGPCPADCWPCRSSIVNPGSGPESGRFYLNDVRVIRTANDALMEYADCLRDDACRSGLPTHIQLSNYSRIDVDALGTNADAIVEAVGYYVDRHMQYMYDRDGEVQSAVYTIEDSGSRSGNIPWENGTTLHVDTCPNDYCGDCEDHAILRHALMRVLGFKRQCSYLADHYDGYWGGGHTFNIVKYQNKWRILDYGPLGNYFETDWSEHRPHNVFNDRRGVYWCPDWKDNLGDGHWDAGCDKTSPRSYAWNYDHWGENQSEYRCPRSFDGYWTYRTDTCP
jgi:hypothetical protein